MQDHNNPFDFQGRKVVIIGGSSGIGLQTAKSIHSLNGQLVLAGRSLEKLEKARLTLNDPTIEIFSLDNRKAEELEKFFEKVGPFDFLFTPAAAYTKGPITADLETAKSCFEGKFWPQYMAVKFALKQIHKQGAIVLMAGAYSQRPSNDGASYTACNAAIENLAKALAVELAPLRVNAISPGTIKTSFSWEGKGSKAHEETYDEYAQQCLLKKVGEAKDIAQAVVYLLLNENTTASTLYPDGGYTLK